MTCPCYLCVREDYINNGRNPLFIGMAVCAKCGNKRCPHAHDHRLDCSGSNAPGQPGSGY